ncbi:MAG: PDZ domain-containing protein [Saprospiraceae bacterium]|nr:PDZ domain-containing protein [Saprospiraceae bacterium]
MKVSEALSRATLLILLLVAIDSLPLYAQKEKTKVTIIKEYYDEEGNKVVKTIVKEGAEADAIDIDRLAEEPGSDIQWHNFNLDGIDPDFQGFNFNFGETFDLRSLLDSMGLGSFDLFDQEGFGSFDEFNLDRESEFRPKLGIKISELDSQAGVLVNHVIPDSPAHRAGLKEGDVILALDNEKISEPQDVIKYVQTLEAEDDVVIDVLRDGEHKELKATLTQFKPKKEIEIRKI